MPLDRHFTVAVFVVWNERVLLHAHTRLGMWLPPGGHIEPGELPDEAAVREVQEETGVRIRLVGERGLAVDYPAQLAVPVGVQVEDIETGHQHIDLIYFATPEPDGERVDPSHAENVRAGWYTLDELRALGANDEIQAWARRAVREIG